MAADQLVDDGRRCIDLPVRLASDGASGELSQEKYNRPTALVAVWVALKGKRAVGLANL